MSDWNPFVNINITSGELLGLALIMFSTVAMLIMFRKMIKAFRR